MLTREEILLEYGKCLMSPIYAIETYLETFDKTQEGFVPFKLFPRQKEIIHAYEKNRFNLITKPRQAGVSTTTAAYHSIKVAFADEENPEAVLIIANKQELAFEFLAKIKDFVSQLPRWVWGPDYYGSTKNEEKSIFITDSKKEIKLPNGSRVKAVATSKDALRGFTPTYLVMDEAAYIDNGAIVFGAALTALGTGGKATLISTPNGMDKLYYETYTQSKAKKNNFNIIEMKWYEDLRYNKDLKWLKDGEELPEIEFTFDSYKRKIAEGYKPTSSWYEEMCRGMNNDAKMIAQELDVSFIGSGGNVINEEDIEMHNRLNVMDPQYVSGAENEIWIWKQPEEGHQYIMGADVSRGDGEDFSTIVILDFTTMEQVMEYQGKIQPDLLAQLVEEYGELYKAYTVVDITGGMGVSTVLKLMEFDYKRLHYDTPNGKILSSKQKQMESFKKNDKVPGLQVSSIRLQMISNFEEKVRNNLVKIRSVRLTTEMKTFVYKNGRPDHMDGYHDDLIMALAMCLWVLEHSFKNLERLEKQTKAILNSWLSVSSENAVLDERYKGSGFVSKENRQKQAAPRPNFSPVVAKNMQDPTGQYMWLFSGSR
jgi:Terminase large subunit, T4likevirus-type, N-terminal